MNQLKFSNYQLENGNKVVMKLSAEEYNSENKDNWLKWQPINGSGRSILNRIIYIKFGWQKFLVNKHRDLKLKHSRFMIFLRFFKASLISLCKYQL